MAVGIFWKKLAETYFVSNGGNIQRTPNLFTGVGQAEWFLIDPTVLQSNGGGPTVVSSTSVLNSLRKYDSTLLAPLANCTTSAWVANGWTLGPTFLASLSKWAGDNFDNMAINVNLNAMNLLYSEVTLEGTDYIIACCYFGNTGSISIADGGFFTLASNQYPYTLDGYQFTATISNPQPVDGGLFKYT